MKFKTPFIIAEVSANHNGSIDNAKKLILLAKKNGADAVKIQTYTADTITLKSNNKFFKIKNGLWKGKNLWQLYNEASTPYSWHKELFLFAKKNKILLFSSPFDKTAVDLLESLNCPIYKVASFELTDFPLIKKISQTKKPLIISTGTSTLQEIEKTFYYAKKNGAKDISLLYCVSNYPAKSSDFNLNNINILKKKFNCKVGFSDHSNDNEIAFSAALAGAEIFEKHIALKNIKSHDYKFSLKNNELKKYKDKIQKAIDLLGKKQFILKKNEIKSKFYRKSIFASKKIKLGEKFTRENIKVVRPGVGISSIYYEKLLNKKSPSNINEAHPISKKIISKLNLKP